MSLYTFPCCVFKLRGLLVPVSLTVGGDCFVPRTIESAIFFCVSVSGNGLMRFDDAKRNW